MVEVEEWPGGSSVSVLVFALLCGFTTVFAVSYSMTRDNDMYISLSPLFAWETILFLSSLLSMLLFTVYRKNNIHVTDCIISANHDYTYLDSTETDNQVDYTRTNMLPIWARFPLRLVVLTMFCFGSISFPIFQAYRAMYNITCFNSDSSKVLLSLKFLRNMSGVLFCLSQLAFILRCKNKAATSPLKKISVSVLVVANYALCVNAVFDIIWVSNTIDLNSVNKASKFIDISEHELQRDKLYLHLSCVNQTAANQTLKIYTVEIDKVAEYFYKYTYQFPIEYALLSLCYLWPIWDVSSQGNQHMNSIRNCETFDRNRSSFSADNGLEETNEQETVFQNLEPHPASMSSVDSTERTQLVKFADRPPVRGIRWRRLKLATKSTLICYSRNAFIPTALLVCACFSLLLYTEIENAMIDDNDIVLRQNTTNNTISDTDQANFILHTVYTYAIFITAFIGFMMARKEKVAYRAFTPSDILLLFVTTGNMLLFLFQSIDSIDLFAFRKSTNVTTKSVLFFINCMFFYFGTFLQTVLIIKASKIVVRQASMENGKQLFMKGIIVFVGVYNGVRWADDNFLPPMSLNYADRIGYNELYGQLNWWFIAELLYPIITLDRLFTGIRCFEICVRFKRILLQNMRSH